MVLVGNKNSKLTLVAEDEVETDYTNPCVIKLHKFKSIKDALNHSVTCRERREVR